MALPLPPNISAGQIALDPVNGIVYYIDNNGNKIATTWSWLRQDLEEVITNDNVTITGDLTVSGTTVSVNVESVVVADNILILNSNVDTAPSENAGIEIERGTSTNVQIRWNESIDKWQFTNDGTTFYDISSIVEGSVELGYHTTGDYVKNLVAGTGISITDNSGEGATPNISLNAGINLLTDVDINSPAPGDFLRYTGSQWINDPVDLATDTVGNYVQSLIAGTGVVITNNTGEGATPTIAIGQDISTSATPTFAGVIAPLTGNVTGNVIGNVTGNVTGNVSGTVSDISNHGINDLSDVSLSSPESGDFLRYNGSNWINDPVNLTTDTVGDYVAKLAAGSGITITNNSGEGATPNIAFSGSIDDISDIQITSAVNGQTLIYNGTNWVNTTFPSTEPIGHENKADSVISFNEGSRQFSIAPASSSYTVWCTGKRYVKTSTETVTIPDTSGLYYIYFNSSGSLAYKTTYFTWDQDTPTAYIYWNDVDNKAYFFADERHGVTLDWATHEYLHRTRGAAIASGFGVNNYTTTGDGSSDAHCQLDIANGTFFDEDLQVDIEHSATPTSDTWQQRIQSGAYIPVFYRSGSVWKKDVATQFPVKQGAARAQYNLYSGGTWSTVDINNNQFGVSWIVATNNLNEPIIAILGQTQETNVGNAQAIDFSSLDLSGFPVFEFRPLYKFIYDTSNTYSNTPHTALKSLIDIRQVISGGTGISAVAISDHGNLTGLQDDDHTQYFNSARHDAHDHSTALNSAVLNDLGDVTITSVATNQGLIWDGSAWVNSNIPLNLDGLSDVIITAATPNQVLKYDGTNWVNAAAPGGSFAGTTYIATVGDGSSSSFTINHGLSTRNIVVTIAEANAPYGNIQSHWEATTLNSITVYFANPPANNSVIVSIYAAVSGAATNVNSINDIEDVVITSATPGQALVWDGTNWVNSVVSGGGGGGTVNSYASTIGDGVSLNYQITHNLGTRDIILQARNENSPYEYYNIAWEATTINIATVYFDTAPASNSVRIKIVA